jgi:tetratricopeptide (TPR) repeat protein
MRTFPLVLVLFLFSAVAGFASEPIPVVVSRWDWAAVKFNQEAENDLRKGDLEAARRNIAEALRRAPTYWPTLFTRAQLFSREGKWDLAIRDCNEVLRQYSAFAPAALLRAHVNAKLGNYAAVKKELDHVVAIQPRPQFCAMAFAQRALFRATCPNPSFRDARGAIDDAKKACTVTSWREADPIDTLAIAYAESGDFDSAIRYEQQAMSTSDANEISRTLQEHMSMLKQHRPVRIR